MNAPLSWLKIVGDMMQFLRLCFRSRTSLAAENLFLRKQLAFYRERKIKPRRADNPTRLTLALLSRWFGTLVVWHRKGWRLFWLEIPIWPAPDSSRPPMSDSQDGAR